jgi:hypothetical protein
MVTSYWIPVAGSFDLGLSDFLTFGFHLVHQYTVHLTLYRISVPGCKLSLNGRIINYQVQTHNRREYRISISCSWSNHSFFCLLCIRLLAFIDAGFWIPVICLHRTSYTVHLYIILNAACRF